ncbi:aspartyl protease family protein [bacterium]|nr:aspartyl protease family protein [bacterium]
MDFKKKGFKMKNLLLIFLILHASLSALPQQMELLVKFNSGKPYMNEDTTRIQFNLIAHKIYLKVKVNDSRPFNFILDTGAITAIDQDVATELNLERGTALPALDTLMSAYISKGPVKINVGDLSVCEFIPIITDLPDASDSEPSLDGFIGSDFLRFFCLTINYQEKTLMFSSDKLLPSEPFYTVQMEKFFPLGFPMIDCIINQSHNMKMMIDTGSPFSFVCPISVIDDDDIFNDQVVLKSYGTFMKWPSTTTEYNYLSYARSFKCGDFNANNIPIFFAELPRQFSSGLIGKDFLCNFITTIDYLNNEIFLEPVQHKYEDNMFSIGLSIKKKDSRFFVKSIWQDSPAHKSGVKVNDEILKLNNYNAKDLSIEKINNILNNDEISVIHLDVKNINGENSMSLTKCDLLGILLK